MARIDMFSGRTSLPLGDNIRISAPSVGGGINPNTIVGNENSYVSEASAAQAISRTQVAGVDGIGEALQSVGKLGEAISGVVGDIVKAKRQEDMDQAMVKGLVQVRSLRDTFRDRKDYDPDSRNWEAEYDQKAKVLVDTLSQGLTERDKNSFVRRMVEPVIIQREHISTQGRKVWLDDNQAKGIDEIYQYKQLTLGAESPEEQGFYLANALGGIDTRVEAGIWSREQGEKLKQGFAKDVGSHILEARAFHDPTGLVEDLKSPEYMSWIPGEVKFAAERQAQSRIEHLEAEQRRMEREARAEAREQLTLAMLDANNQIELARRTGQYDTSVLADVTRLARSAGHTKIALTLSSQLTAAQRSYEVGQDLTTMPLADRPAYLDGLRQWSLESDQAQRAKVLDYAEQVNAQQVRSLFQDPKAYLAPVVERDLARMGIKSDSPDYQRTFNQQLLNKQEKIGLPLDVRMITDKYEADRIRGTLDRLGPDQLIGALSTIKDRYGTENLPRVLREVRVDPSIAVAAQIFENGQPNDARFFLEAARRKPDEISVSSRDRSSVKEALDSAWKGSNLGRFLDEGQALVPYVQGSMASYRTDLRGMVERGALSLVEGGKDPGAAVSQTMQRLQGHLGQFSAGGGVLISAPPKEDIDLIKKGLNGARSGIVSGLEEQRGVFEKVMGSEAGRVALEDLKRDMGNRDRTVWVDHGDGVYALLDTESGRIFRDAQGHPFIIDAENAKSLGNEVKFSHIPITSYSVGRAIQNTINKKRVR